MDGLTESERAELYKELAAAVVWQAIYDYKESEHIIEKAADIRKVEVARYQMESIERFSTSDRFKMFSEVDGRHIMAVVKRMSYRQIKRKYKEG